MARPTSPLSPDALEPALDYLRRAVNRGADIFSKPPATVASSFSDLIKRASTTTGAVRADAMNKWVARHVTAEGRVRMLAALRRRRADAVAGDAGSRTVRLTGTAYLAAQSLAHKVGMPLATALDSLVHVALADRALQDAVVKLGVALRAKQTAGVSIEHR